MRGGSDGPRETVPSVDDPVAEVVVDASDLVSIGLGRSPTMYICTPSGFISAISELYDRFALADSDRIANPAPEIRLLRPIAGAIAVDKDAARGEIEHAAKSHIGRLPGNPFYRGSEYINTGIQFLWGQWIIRGIDRVMEDE